MNPTDPENDKHNFDNGPHDADDFHISPEIGEQGEGPGEQGVRRITITDVSSPSSSKSSAPRHPHASVNSDPRFNHGDDDVMHYFTDDNAGANSRPTPSPDPIPSSWPKPNAEGIAAPQSSHSFKGENGTNSHSFNAPLDEDGNSTTLSASGSSRQRERTIGRAPATAGGPTGARSDNVGESTVRSDANLGARSASASEAFHGDARSDRDLGARSESSAKKPAKKFNLAATITIVLVTVVITAAAVFIALFITQQGNSKDNVVTKAPVANTPAPQILKCTKNTADSESTVIANYSADAKTNKYALDDYSIQTEYTYSDTVAAEEGLKHLRSAYNDKINELKLTGDPFSFVSSQKERTVTTSVYAEADEITAENIELLSLPKPEEGKSVELDVDALKATLTGNGFSCKVKSSD